MQPLRLWSWMMLCALVAMPGAAWSQKTKPFYAGPVGIVFEHPESWTVVKQKNSTELTIRDSQGASIGVLQLFYVFYRQTPDEWQSLQETATKQTGRTIERQWQEEILGVPMLLTKVSSDSGGRTTLVGLLYSATPRKLNFRLNAPGDTYAAAEAQWRSVMQTMRTTTGQLPTTEDPNKPTNQLVVPPPKPKSSVTLTPEKKSQRKPKYGPIEVRTKAGGGDAVLYLPSGWTAEATGDAFLLKRPNLAGELTLAVLSTLDSGLPDAALSGAAAKSIASFTKVAKRLDPKPTLTSMGMLMQSVYREGSASDGERVVLHAVLSSGDMYGVATYTARSLADYKRDRKAIDSLFNQIALLRPR